MKAECPGRGGGSGNFYFQVKTEKHAFSSGVELMKVDEIVLRITPIYQIVQSFCISSGEFLKITILLTASHCIRHGDSTGVVHSFYAGL
jgi:hypothetical protein